MADAQPLDANYKPLNPVLYDPATSQFVVQQTGGTVSTGSDGTKYSSASTIIQASGGAPIAALPANTPPTLANTPTVVTLSPANTGLPVNGPDVVQTTGNKSTGSVASLAKAFVTPTIAGNSIVVVCGVGNGTAPTVSDTQGNVYTQAAISANSTTFEVAIFFAVNITGGANTVTVTNTGTAASMAMQIYEVSGILNQIAGQGAQNTSSTGTGTTASTPAISPITPNRLAFAGIGVGTAAQTITPATGWINDSGQQNPTTPAGLFSFVSMSEYLAGMQPITPSASIAVSEPWSVVSVLFKQVSLPVEGSVSIIPSPNSGYTYTHITTATTTLIKTGAGTLRAIAINKPVANATIEFDDAVTQTNAIGLITIPGTITSMAPFVMRLDIAFATGLSVSTGAATDITVIWK